MFPDEATVVAFRTCKLVSFPAHVECGHKKSRALHTSAGISATRLSQGDPLGFPSHPRGWFSIIVYRMRSSL